MTDTPAKKTARDPVLEQLVAAFPAFRDTLPLAIGIHKLIRERLPELTRDQVGRALRIHTGSTRYLKALSRAGQRFDLDGQPAGEVTEEQRKQAAGQVRERIQKANERRKAEEEAKRTQEKLQQLAAKFNQR